MPRPSSALGQVRPDLADGLEQFNLANDRMSFVGLQIMPVFEAATKSGQFSKRTLAQILQSGNTARGQRGAYGRGEQKFGTDNFTTTEQGWEEAIDDNEREVYRDWIDAEMAATQACFDVVLRNQEIRIADALFDTGTFTGAMTNAVTTEWSTAASATPIADINVAKKAIWARTGIWPDTLVFNYHVFLNVRACDEVIQRVQSQGAGSSTLATNINTAMLASAFDLKRVVVCGAPKNTANESSATATISNIWSSEYAMLTKTADTGNLREPCIGRTFHWGQDGSELGGHIETYRDEPVRADIVRVRHQVGEKILYPELGQLLSNITA